MGSEPIGIFPPGDYTVMVDFAYDNYPFGLAVITLGVIPFTVIGAMPAAPIPTSSLSAQIVLVFLVSVAALWSLRMRRLSRY